VTRLGGEDVLIVEKVLNPCHDIIYVCRCCKVDALAILVDPCIIEVWSSRHGGTRLLRTALRNDTVKFVEVGIEVEHIDSNPFHDINIFWENNDSLEVTFHQSCFDERTAKIERFRGCWAAGG